MFWGSYHQAGPDGSLLQLQVLWRQRQEDCEFKASLGKVSKTMPQNSKIKKSGGDGGVF
jgi:hypothetical protein